jgi:hypothetical protein
VVLEKGKNREKKTKEKEDNTIRHVTLEFGEDKGVRKKDKSLGCILSRKAKQQGHEKIVNNKTKKRKIKRKKRKQYS